MKYSKYFAAFFFIGLVAITCCQSLIAQDDSTGRSDPKKLAFKNMVDSQHFVFVAQSVTPLRGQFRNLTSSYDVRVSKDTMVSYLPYFGRAYSAPVDPSALALSFTSTNFSYLVTPAKKGGWNVSIKPKDYTDVQQFLFTIYDNGSAHLSVTSISRDAISFNGYVEKENRKKKKKK